MSLLSRMNYNQQLTIKGSYEDAMPYFWENKLRGVEQIEDLSEMAKELFIEDFGENFYKKLQKL